MRALLVLVLLASSACGATGTKSDTKAPGSAGDGAGSTPAAAGKYCTKYGLCYDDVSRSDYASDEELMCAQYCTYYCTCYEKIEGEKCYEGGGCALACERDLAKEELRDDWLRRLRCAQEAQCKRFMDEC